MAGAWTPTQIGEKVAGVIENTFEKQQTGGETQIVNGKPKFVPNNEPKFFKNGQPAMALVVVLRVAEETSEDNGQRAVYINRPSRMFTAVSAALKEAGAKEPEVGDYFEVTYTGVDAESANGNAKLFKAKYVKAGAVSDATPAAAPVVEDKAAANAEAEALLARLAQLTGKA